MPLRNAFGRDLRTATVAVVAASVVAGPTAVAAAYVANSDKVDNKHAVGSGASLNARKGKLVATNPKTGLLPNNIIAKALDSNTVDGLDSTAFLSADGKAADADELDGLDSAELLPRHASASFAEPNDGMLGGLIHTVDDLAQISITVPGPGRIHVAGTTVLWAQPAPEEDSFAELSINDAPDAENPSPAAQSIWAVRQGADNGSYYETVPTQATFEVSAPGTYTYYVVGRGSAPDREPAGNGPLHYTTQVTAQYFPAP